MWFCLGEREHLPQKRCVNNISVCVVNRLLYRRRLLLILIKISVLLKTWLNLWCLQRFWFVDLVCFWSDSSNQERFSSSKRLQVVSLANPLMIFWFSCQMDSLISINNVQSFQGFLMGKVMKYEKPSRLGVANWGVKTTFGTCDFEQWLLKR
jgi:hypothetical protein